MPMASVRQALILPEFLEDLGTPMGTPARPSSEALVRCQMIGNGQARGKVPDDLGEVSAFAL
jgi:hypothetical protein